MTVASVTVGSFAFWKVFGGCMWFCGVVAYALDDGCRGLTYDAFFVEFGGARRRNALILTTIFWPISWVVAFFLTLLLVAGLLIGKFLPTREEDDMPI